MKQRVNNELLLNCAKEMLDEGHTVSLRVAGYSMRPLLEHRRDNVTLAKADLGALQRFDILLFKADERYILHRLIKIDGENLTFMGDGNLAGTEQCTKADVIGIVVGIERKGRKIDCRGKWSRRYGAIWNALRPIRKWLLLAYRAKRKFIP